MDFIILNDTGNTEDDAVLRERENEKMTTAPPIQLTVGRPVKKTVQLRRPQ